MKNIFWGITGIVVIIAGIIFAYYERTQVDSSVVKIGYVGPLSGDAATYGEPMRNAARMAADEINAAGGIGGKKLELIYEDSKCAGKDALTAVQKLISVDRVRILDGFACAEEIITAAPVIEQNNILTLTQASGPRVSLAGDYIFQTDPSATTATGLLASLIFENQKTVAVIGEKTAFASDISGYFVQVFESLGGEVTAVEEYSSDTKDFRTILAKIKQSNPSAIFVNPQTEIAGGLIVKQARDLGIAVPLFGLDTLSGETVRQTSGTASNGITVVAVPDLDPDNQIGQRFLANYRARFGEPPFALYLAAAYDSVYLIAQALENAGDDPTEMKDYLYAIPEYNGAVGTYHFDSNGDITGIDFTVKRVIDGELINVSQ